MAALTPERRAGGRGSSGPPPARAARSGSAAGGSADARAAGAGGGAPLGRRLAPAASVSHSTSGLSGASGASGAPGDAMAADPVRCAAMRACMLAGPASVLWGRFESAVQEACAVGGLWIA